MSTPRKILIGLIILIGLLMIVASYKKDIFPTNNSNQKGESVTYMNVKDVYSETTIQLKVVTVLIVFVASLAIIILLGRILKALEKQNQQLQTNNELLSKMKNPKGTNSIKETS